MRTDMTRLLLLCGSSFTKLLYRVFLCAGVVAVTYYLRLKGTNFIAMPFVEEGRTREAAIDERLPGLRLHILPRLAAHRTLRTRTRRRLNNETR